MSRPRARDDRGLTLPIIALCLPILILMVGMAVDLGRQRSDRRLAQAGADVVALDMIRIVGARSLGQVLSDAATVTALEESAARNGFVSTVGLVTTTDPHLPRVTNVEWGALDGSTFVPLDPTPGVDTDGDGTDDLDEVPAAVRITAERSTDYFFQPGEKGVTRLAVASTDRHATIKLGSFAARIASGNSPLLAGVLGDALNTGVLGYEGLLASDIDLELLATELNLGSPSEVLASEVTLAELYTASADALRNDPDSDADDLANADFFDAMAASAAGGGDVTVGDVIGAEAGGEDAALEGTVNAFDLFSGAALVANGTNALAVPSLTLAAGMVQIGTPCDANPGNDATEVCSALTVVQGAVTFSGHVGTARGTKQARARLGTSATILGLANATTQLDLALASSRAEIADIDCEAPRTVTIGVSTGLADASVRVTGTISVLGRTVPVTITLDRPPSSDFESPVFTEQPDGTFTPPYYEAGTQDLGLSGATASVALDLTGVPVILRSAVQAASGAVLAPILTSVTGPVLTALDSATTPLLNQLGLNLAGADVSTLAIDNCATPRLVG